MLGTFSSLRLKSEEQKSEERRQKSMSEIQFKLRVSRKDLRQSLGMDVHMLFLNSVVYIVP